MKWEAVFVVRVGNGTEEDIKWRGEKKRERREWS